jgi:hypothetical protein
MRNEYFHDKIDNWRVARPLNDKGMKQSVKGRRNRVCDFRVGVALSLERFKANMPRREATKFCPYD